MKSNQKEEVYDSSLVIETRGCNELNTEISLEKLNDTFSERRFACETSLSNNSQNRMAK